MTKYMHMSMELWGGIFCAICAVLVFLGRNKEEKSDLWMMIMEATVSLLLVIDALAWGYRGVPGRAARIIVQVTNFSVFFLSYIILAEYTMFLYRILEKKTTFPIASWINGVMCICIMGMALMVSNIFTNTIYYIDAGNFYHRADMYYITQLIAGTGMVLDAALLIFCRKCISKWMMVSMATYMVFPFVSSIVLIFVYGISLLNISMCASLLMIYISWQIDKVMADVKKTEKLMEQEKLMSKLQTDVMLSQIQPHFLMNSLTAIARMCDKDHVVAKQATLFFAEYLRENINALKSRNPVPFDQELNHIQNYTYLEQLRFGNALKIEYDIDAEDFMIPTLSVQPLVENAIKHGIKNNGKVLIKTREYDEYYEVSVIDDGIGMDYNRMESLNADNSAGEVHTHIGIKNVRKRIEDMCEGTLEYRPGKIKGTEAIIKIPKKK